MPADSRSESDEPQPELSERELSSGDPEAPSSKVPRPKGRKKPKTETHSRFNPEQPTLT